MANKHNFVDHTRTDQLEVERERKGHGTMNGGATAGLNGNKPRLPARLVGAAALVGVVAVPVTAGGRRGWLMAGRRRHCAPAADGVERHARHREPGDAGHAAGVREQRERRHRGRRQPPLHAAAARRGVPRHHGGHGGGGEGGRGHGVRRAAELRLELHVADLVLVVVVVHGRVQRLRLRGRLGAEREPVHVDVVEEAHGLPGAGAEEEDEDDGQLLRHGLFLQGCFLVTLLEFAGEVAGEKHELAVQDL
jgi:hypothetical protein